MRLSERASRWVHRVVLPVAVGLAATFGSAYLVERPGPLNAAEARLAPRPRRAEASPDGAIVVGIGNRTIETLKGDVQNGRLPRPWLGRMLRALSAAGAKVAVLDVFLPLANPKEDPELVAALRAKDEMRTVLMTRYYEPTDQSGYPDMRRNETGVVGTFRPCVLYDPKTMPRVELASGSAMGAIDSEAIIGAIPWQTGGDGQRPLLYAAFQAALQANGVDARSAAIDPARHILSAPPFEWHLLDNQELRLVEPERRDDIPTLEFCDVLKSLETASGKARLKGRIAVIGYTNGRDDHDTPRFEGVSGPWILAGMVDTARLSADYRLRNAPDGLAIPLYVALGAGGFAFAFSRRTAAALFGVAALLLLAWTLPDVLAATAGISTGRLPPTLAVALASLVGLFAAASGLYRADHRAEGAVEEATVLFVDVRGSTHMLNEIGPQAYRALMRDLLDEGAKVVRAGGGAVERTLGDGFLAVFRAGRGHHARRAAGAVAPLLQCAEAVSRRHGLTVAVGIGFETGMVTGGYVTEGGHRTWSSAGRAVNLAQRLQSATEGRGVSVAVGPVAARMIETEFSLRPLGTIEAKGFAEPVEAYTIAEPDTATQV